MLARKWKTKNLRSFGAIAAFLVIGLLWALGWTDYLFEEPFSTFKWPPYINVREQVLLEMSGRPASHVYENDWAYFEPFHMPACGDFNKESKNFLLIIVKSSPYHFSNREAVRATWGSVSSHSEFVIRTIFVIGRETVDYRKEQRLQREIKIHKDVLVGNYVDSYLNNTLKFLSAVQFSFNYCLQQYTVPYALFVDDDYLVLVQNLVAEVKKHNVHDRLYMGWKFVTRPFRTRLHKHWNREAVRATWGSVSSHSEFVIRTIFVIGRETVDYRKEQRLQREIKIHKDVLVGNYIDSYLNNTLKFLSAVQFSFNYCLQQYTVPYALFVDDDYLVLVQNLVAEVKKHNVHDRLYMGWKFVTRPFRTRLHKHWVSLSTYPFNRYPPYISAGAVLLSSQSIREMYYGIQHTRLFVYDDVYAGILAKSLDLPVAHNKNMRFWKSTVSVEDSSTVICAHGFEGEQLKSTYYELKSKSLS